MHVLGCVTMGDVTHLLYLSFFIYNIAAALRLNDITNVSGTTAFKKFNFSPPLKRELMSLVSLVVKEQSIGFL